MQVFFRKYGKIILFLFSLIIGSAGLYLVSQKLFSIEEIEVVGNGFSVSVDQQRIPKNLLFFPTDSVIKDILKDNQLVTDVEIKKKFPHTLQIIASGRQPIGRILTGGRQWGVDRLGIIVSEIAGSSSLPILDIPPQSFEIGQRIISDRVEDMLGVISTVETFLPLLSITATESASILAKTAETNIFIAQGADSKTIAATLQMLLAGFRIKGNLPTKIDLRFDKPVVVF